MKYLFQALILLFIPFISSTLNAQPIELSHIFQEEKIIYFSTETDQPKLADKLNRIVSVDHYDGKNVYAYANEYEFGNFLKQGLPWKKLPDPEKTDGSIRMLDKVNLREVESWDFYPTYDAYLDIMNQFATDYPDLCDTLSIGQSEEGRELMMVRISDNINMREAEPQFLYTGTMHGDELVGYILLLRLADYLLSNYGSDPEITELVNNTEIWINPLANPDGTFHGGNHTVWNSIRYNSNYVDLNRNYPDPDDGPHPDGNEYQAETLAFMQLAEEQHFVMSANLHGGSEVINYPWDTWIHLTADNDWWVDVCRGYADTVHQYAPAYYLDGFDNGITNGYDWYTISGGRQDFMNYFHHCREVTMELSNTKKLSESLLDDHWEWNYRSLLNYIRQCTYGVNGIVTDAQTGDPVPAKIYIDGHDEDNSFVYADPATGYYQRLLYPGTYSITYSADGYQPTTVEDVTVAGYSTTTVDVALSAGELEAKFTTPDTLVNPGSAINFTDQSTGNPTSWNWTFQGGAPATSTVQHPQGIVYGNPGSYDVILTVKNNNGDISTVTKNGYITVNQSYLMANQTVTITEGVFYDSGGEGNNYQNNEDFEMTFLPAFEDAKIQVSFLEFNIEEHSSCNYDWLRIFDGSSASSTFLGTWCGSESPGVITATNPEGALTFTYHSDYSVTLPGWKALIKCKGNQEVSLSDGWSGISLFVDPDDTNLEDLFSEVADNLEIVIGNTGIYWPSSGINTIGNWEPKEGYIIKMNDPSSLQVSGTLHESNTVQLNTGWNYLPVLSKSPVQADQLLNALSESLVVVKEIAGVNTYWPDMGIFTLMYLEPGNAYLIYLTADAEYTFPGLN